MARLRLPNVTFQRRMEYLGHMVKPGQLEINKTNFQSLIQAKPPTNKKQMKSFLGLSNAYQRFIEVLNRIGYELNKLLKKGSPDTFQSDDEQKDAFTALLSKVGSPPEIDLPKANLRYSIDCDASDYGISWSLFQTHRDGERKPIGFWPRLLLAAEANYSASER